MGETKLEVNTEEALYSCDLLNASKK